MSIQDYCNYSLSDFLDDDQFIRWVIKADPESQTFWESFLLQYPDKHAVLKEAAAIITAYRTQDSFTNEQHKPIVWERIHATIQHQQNNRAVTRIIPLYYKVAAAVAFVTVCSAALWLFINSKHTITTAYGEVKTITLPDNSVVTLNGNSSISYKDDWNAESPREIWIDGEAYFDVRHINKDITHIAPGHRFLVHSNGVNIEVLGTTFNVKHREDETNIALITGKVKVNLADNSSATQDLIMAPGDYVAYKSKTLVSKGKLRKVSAVTAWTKQEFAFIDPYLKDIVKTLRDDHGYTIDVKDDKLMTLRIEGEINVSSVHELLSTVEVTLGLRIKESNKRIVISRK